MAKGTFSAETFGQSLLFRQVLETNEVSRPLTMMHSIAQSAAGDRRLRAQPAPTTPAPPIRIEAAAADRAAREERAAWDAIEPEWQGRLQSQLAGGFEDVASPWNQPMAADGVAKIAGRSEPHQLKSETSKIRRENREAPNNS
jgi:hypothetical protein